MKDLEVMIRKKYDSLRRKKTEKEAAFRAAENWAEDWVVRTNGKLTISSENEIHKIMDRLHESLT
jgi:hypothetical protein